MAVQTFGRTRTLVTPDLESGTALLLGKFYAGIQVGGVYTGQYSATPSAPQFYNAQANHPWTEAKVTMDTVHLGPPFLSGDAFTCLKYVWCTPFAGVFGSGTYERLDKSQKYVGGFKPPSEFSPLGIVDKFSFGNTSMSSKLKGIGNLNLPTMDGLGDKAWKQTKPKLQKADGAVFTSELRDMPRMLKQTASRFDQIWRAMGGTYTSKKEVLKSGLRIMQPKRIADDFLAQQFGWIPFVKDLIKFDSVVQHYYPLIAKAVARNDKWVRRRITMLDDVVETPIRNENTNRCFSVAMHANYFTEPPLYTVTEVKKTFVSGVGKFKYYRPEFDVSVQDNISQWNQAQQFLTLTGFRITPTNLYNAFPWTWAIDWFSNLGDHIDKINDYWVDSIVSAYCFVMKHEETVRHAIQRLNFHATPIVLEFDRKIDAKVRHKATSPYDFNLTWDDLTPRQLAIAAALGIGRFPKIAR